MSGRKLVGFRVTVGGATFAVYIDDCRDWTDRRTEVIYIDRLTLQGSDVDLNGSMADHVYDEIMSQYTAAYDTETAYLEAA